MLSRCYTGIATTKAIMKTLTTNTPITAAVHVMLWPYLQRIQDAVRSGHTRVIQGQIAAKKAANFWIKCDALYAVSASAAKRHDLRKRGYTTGRLFFYHPGYGDVLEWCLLITEGMWIAIDPREHWQERPMFRHLECLRLPKPGQNHPPVTWRIMPKELDMMMPLLIAHIRRHEDEQLKQSIQELWHTPGFAGVRSQLFTIKRRLLSEFRRSRPSETVLEFPRSFYLNRQSNELVKISVLAKRIQKAMEVVAQD